MTTASTEAYVSIVDKLPKKRAAVYQTIRERGVLGAIIREVRIHLGWENTTVSARIHELAEEGLIKPHGERDGQTVWVLTPSDKVEWWKEQRRAERERRDHEKEQERVRALVDARYVYLPSTVRGDLLFSDTAAPAGVYKAHVNPQGAVSVRATDGKLLGVKPSEYIDVKVTWA